MVRLIACIAMLSLGGCVTTTRNVGTDYRLSDKGLLVASVTAAGYNPGTLILQVVRTAEPGRVVVAIPVNDEVQGLDWRLGDAEVINDGLGRLAVVELEPGNYELRRGHIHVSETESYTQVRPMGYRFTIQRGKATYLGNVHVDLELSPAKRLLAWHRLTDRRKRDLPILHRKHPGIRAEELVIAADAEYEAAINRPRDISPTKLEDLQGVMPSR